MSQKKPGKKEKERENISKKKKSELSKISELEVELKPSEEKKPDSEKEMPENSLEEDSRGVGFQRELARVLDFGDSAESENFSFASFGGNLEGAVFFAPRIIEKEDVKDKDYSASKYDSNMYNESRYNEQTPGAYSEKSDASSGNRGSESSQQQ